MFRNDKKESSNLTEKKLPTVRIGARPSAPTYWVRIDPSARAVPDDLFKIELRLGADKGDVVRIERIDGVPPTNRRD